MCLAVPGRIRSIDDSNQELKMAKVEFGGIIKDICVQWIADVKVGDYVMVHAGTALSKVKEDDAKATLEVLREMGEIMDNPESDK